VHFNVMCIDNDIDCCYYKVFSLFNAFVEIYTTLFNYKPVFFVAVPYKLFTYF